MISDIVLADEISPQADASQIISCYTRNGLNILPNVSQYFLQNDTLLVYFELYNLDLDLSGNIHFTVETALHRKDKGGFFQSIFGSNTEKMSIVNEYSGRRTDEFVVQSVQLSNLEPGEYKLEITVRDKNTGRMIRKNTNMTLLEALTN
ncbi:MAG: hypothetical protein EH225_03770 [Calditrichaeota bacterium]|nr:MAG: hypothetical protein EH225_03770 [Calditrichota bacterium]